MNFKEGISLALQTIKSHKLRSFLTTLGIIIGIMAVIGMVSITKALEMNVRKALSQLGGPTFQVSKYPAVRMGRVDQKYRNREDITFKQMEKLKEMDHKYIDQIIPDESKNIYKIQYRDKTINKRIPVNCSDRGWLKVQNRYLQSGRFFIKSDLQYKRNVVVIGQDIVEELFTYINPVGKKIKMAGERYQVIGVLEEKGDLFGSSQDNLVVIPYTTFTKNFGSNRNISLIVKANSAEVISQARSETQSLLRNVRNVELGKKNNFEIHSQNSIMGRMKSITSSVFIAGIVICSISLLVGGIGIMNIMLVSVNERTREIGVRKAIGARKSDILHQFLIEAIFLCLAGGIGGVGLGSLVGVLISNALNLPTSIPVWAIVLGIGFSSLVGIIFGVYPASKAARLDPIECLRYE